MADVAATASMSSSAASSAGQPPPGNRMPVWVTALNVVSRMVMIFLMYNYFSGTWSNKTTTTSSSGRGGHSGISRNLFQKGDVLDLYLYISEEQRATKTAAGSKGRFWPASALAWHMDDYVYGVDWDERVGSVSIPLSESVKNNGTLYAHVYLTKDNVSPNPSDDSYQASKVFYRQRQLNKYRPDYRKRRVNLLSGEATSTSPSSPDVQSEVVYLSFWTDNITFSVVVDDTSFKTASPPQHLKDYLEFDLQSGNYFPILYDNEFWLTTDLLYPLNDTIQEVSLNVHFTSLSVTWWTLMVQMDQSLKNQAQYGMDGEADNFKHMLVDTSPYLLALTFVVSTLHSVFDFLAFKNEIHFWRNRKDMEGLSVKSLFLNIFFQTIIFLYLWDNETSGLILISSFIGLVIELWKLPKALIIKMDTSGAIPRIKFQERESYVSTTKEYDNQAFRYLSWVAFPLVLAYSAYSLLYDSHKGWYSFVLNTLVGFVYTFGFIMMTPQLFINYKLKSVAHMPWKSFMYKALNTFIDDLFAFIIRMPTLHRLACLRDDVVFIVYLYQRWIYPVDKKRINEFGQSGEDAGAASSASSATATTAAIATATATATTTVTGNRDVRTSDTSESETMEKSPLAKKND